MTATYKRIPLLDAEDVAIELLNQLAPFCDRIEIAGSIRRQKSMVHDIELVTIPRHEVITTDLFGNPQSTRNLLDNACAGLKADGVLGNRLDKNGRPAWGTKYKRAVYRGTPVDLFSATPENWGVIYLLRTGPAGFNRKLMLPKAFGGYLPFGTNFAEGSLWIRGERVTTPEEEDVFDCLGVPWTEPEERR